MCPHQPYSLNLWLFPEVKMTTESKCLTRSRHQDSHNSVTTDLYENELSELRQKEEKMMGDSVFQARGSIFRGLNGNVA